LEKKMKKFVTMLAVIFTVAIMSAGCAGDNVKTYSDAGETIEVKVDGEFIIALDSNPTTGYSWEATYDETQLELISDDYEADETDGLITGAGGTEYFRFKALKAGEFEITLDYQRSWEDEPSERMVFSVEVS
jgi:inhibitor of cysteine peptidase